MRRLTVAAPLVAALAVLGGVSGCSGGSSSSDQSPEDRLAEAKDALDEAEYVGFTLSTPDLPEGLDGLLSASGTGTHDPAFKGEVEVQADLDVKAAVVALDGQVYAELPFVGWSELDPADYGAPDPAALVDPDSGISTLFVKTDDPEAGEQKRSGEEVLTEIRGTIPGSEVQTLFPSAGEDAFDVTYTLTDTNEARTVTMEGPFYDGSDDVTYTIDLDLDADAVDIKAPEL